VESEENGDEPAPQHLIFSEMKWIYECGACIVSDVLVSGMRGLEMIRLWEMTTTLPSFSVVALPHHHHHQPKMKDSPSHSSYQPQ